MGMYLRTTTRRNSDGSIAAYYQLAENVWDRTKRCSIAKVVYNFGRADNLDHDSLVRLARSILRVVGDGRAQAMALAACTDGDPSSMHEHIAIRNTWFYGGLYVLRHVWNEFLTDKVLAQQALAVGSSLPVDAALFAMVANRAMAPCSKLRCFEHWLQREAFLPEAHEIELHQLYLSMDFLEECKERVEKAVYFSMADLMNADVDLIFYDTTSLHFENDEEDEEQQSKEGRVYEAQRKRGHSKNGRSDAPQIVVGLAMTRDGLPVRSWVFPGNTADVTTVQNVKKQLSGWRLGRCVFVGDAGMNSEDNRRKLSLGGGKYILASKMRAGDEVTHEVLTRAGRYREVADNLRVKQVEVGDGERRRRYVVCHNPQEERRQRNHRERLLEQLQREISSMVPTARGHSKRVCEIKSSHRFGKYVKEVQGRFHTDCSKVRCQEQYDGKWVIQSNDDTLTAEDLALGYKQLMRVEECWRTLKSGLGMRPVYHRLPWRIQAHVTISVLALLLERIIEIRCKDTWRNVRDELMEIKVVEYDDNNYRVQQTTELKIEAKELMQKLGIPEPQKFMSIRPISTYKVEEPAEKQCMGEWTDS